MKVVLNQQSLLWIIGILQPVSTEEIKAYMDIAFEDAGRLPDAADIKKFCMTQHDMGRVIRVERRPDLFSLTSKGNDVLSKRARHSRDKTRLYLLKDARKGRLSVSREGPATGLGGDAPPVDERPIIKGREANKLVLVVPSGQAYWPRFSKQLIEETGLLQPSRDIPFLPLLSFSDVRQLALASREDVDNLQLDYNTIGLMLGISPRLIVQIVRNPARHYRTFPLKKKGGGVRIIESPRNFLKVIQQFLTDYYLSGLPVHEDVHSYRSGHSIVTNATRHSGKKFVANMDIENYFGSISRANVARILGRAGFSPASVEIVSRLCTKDDVLPQGAPTSPALSNTYLFDFDTALSEQCAARGLDYTRYADDISISGHNKDSITELIGFAARCLTGEYNLQLNAKKTRVASQHGQQKVTGVVVNEAPRPPRKFRRQVRAAFHYAKRSPEAASEKIPQLAGYVSYLASFPQLRDTAELAGYRKTIRRLTGISKDEDERSPADID